MMSRRKLEFEMIAQMASNTRTKSFERIRCLRTKSYDRLRSLRTTSYDKLRSFSALGFSRRSKKSSDKLFEFRGYRTLFMMWVLWIFIGTAFYALYDEFGWAVGFYMSVNVGYSIGWGDLTERDDISMFFSTLYVLVGASVMSGCLAYFIGSIIRKNEKWYSKVLKKELLDEASTTTGGVSKFKSYLQSLNTGRMRSFLLFALYIIFGTAWSCSVIGWSFTSGLYFAVSSLSTGGLNSIPLHSPSWQYVVVGLYACTGIPVMGIAVGELARIIIDAQEEHRRELDLRARYCKEEIEMMECLGISGGDKKVNKFEFMLLTLARLGVVDTDLINRVYRRFDELDVLRDNVLSYGELLEEVFPPSQCTNTNSLMRVGIDEGDVVTNCLHTSTGSDCS